MKERKRDETENEMQVMMILGQLPLGCIEPEARQQQG